MLATPLSVSVTSKQAGQVTLLSVSVTSKHAGHSSLSQLPANKLATPLSVSVTSKQGQIPKPKQSLMDCMFTYFGVLFALNNDEHLTSSIN